MNDLPSSSDAASLLKTAESAMLQRRWSEAAAIFDSIPGRDNAAGIKRCLSRNLGSLQEHRPAIYEVLISLPKSDHCGIGTSATGNPTVVSRTADGRNLALSPGNRPLDALAGGLKLLAPVLEAGHAYALCGVGDGYLFHQIAQKPPKLYLDTEQAVFLLEPDAHVLLTAMMIHDYSGPTGPIEQARFQWFVGPNWASELRQLLLSDMFLPAPVISLTLGLTAAQTQKTVVGIITELETLNARLRKDVENQYARVDPVELAVVFGPNPPRQPRVLLLTTRFSTVLQYSTHDAAAAFRQAGWDARVHIEPTRHHRVLTIGTRDMLVQFKPDLIFQIDHLRSEHPDVFPANLPFVCWIQDHLAHLMKPEAGAGVGPKDYVMTDSGPLYAHNFGYPPRQLIGVAKLTTVPPLLPAPARPGEDLVFISNASTSPQALREEVLQTYANDVRLQEFVSRCVDRVIDLHEAGENLATYRDAHEFLTQMLDDAGMHLPQDQFLTLLHKLCHPMSDCLYRQQTLGWIADVAKDLGLSLGLYGNGWEKHPRLGAYARGPVAPGQACQELIRGAAINFQIAPYLCLHQRVLDGICSGGFFLVREHLSDVAPQALLDLLEANCPSGISRLNDARAVMPPPVRDRFERLVKDCQHCLSWNGTEDPIEMVRAFEESQLLVAGQGVLPRLAQISFNDRKSLWERVRRFVHDPELRQEVSGEQRQSICARLTYPATMKRVVSRIGELLLSNKNDASLEIAQSRELGKAA